jgi:hypothetical protein
VEPHSPKHKTIKRGGQEICMNQDCQQYLMPVGGPKAAPAMGMMNPMMGGQSPIAMAIGQMMGMV